MSTLLHVSASPRDALSESRALAAAFLGTHRLAHPDVVVEELDLFDGKLPAFGRLAAEAKMAVFGGGQPSAEQQGEWDAARAVFDRFAAADAYLFSVPMWNAGVPYVLKQWIDIISQPLAVQLHPRRRLQRPDPRQEGRRDLHQRRLPARRTPGVRQ